MDEKKKIHEELVKEHHIDDMVSFTDINIQEKLKENAYLIMKYQDFYNTENKIYEELEEIYDALAGSKYDYYRFEYDKGLTKQEIEQYYLPKDKEIRKMKKIMRRQKIRVEFFQTAVIGLRQQAWNLKTFSENERKGM